MPNTKTQQGFSLIEVLVAVLVVSIGLVGLAGMQLVGLKGNQQSFSKNQAAHHAQALLERMRANPSAAVAGDYVVNSATINCSAPVPVNCAAATSSCSAAQVADFDIYQAFCGHQYVSSGGIKGDLANAQLVISCPAACQDGVVIDLRWQEQVLGKESPGADAVPRQLTINTRISE